jgi:type IV secretory pathway VirB6-like protein
LLSKFSHLNKLRKAFANILCLWIFIVAVITPHSSYALYDGPRSNSYSNYKCNVGDISFNPMAENVDLNWVITNPTCAGFVSSYGASIFTAEYLSAYLCFKPKHAAEVSAQAATGVPMSPKTIKRRAKEAAKCSSLLAAQAWGSAALCCGNLAAAALVTGIAIAALALIWDQANKTFKNARICGEAWNQWKYDSESEVWVKTKGPYALCLENLFLQANHPGVSSFCNPNPSRAITNRSYREFIYGGIEYQDNGCKNPSTWDANRRREILGYTSDNQRYYMRGSQNASVYACYRFNSRVITSEDPNTVEADRNAMKTAYDCCRIRSQETLCIENKSGVLSNMVDIPNGIAGGIAGDAYSPIEVGYDHEFCKIGSKCNVGDIVFEVYDSRKHSNYACARTYSVCPYNHLLGGGTEEIKVNSSDSSKIDNFCQYLKHCAKLPLLPRITHSNLEGGFISQACRDFKGDSQNVYGYSAQLLPINTRGFSAPMAQCFKETMENVFLHKAGHTKCINPDEQPSNDFCVSGYVYQKGGDLPGESFFIKIQNNLQAAIKMVLIASVVAFGFAILLAVPNMYINKKILITYVLKIGLIMYFAVGDAWQSGFMTGLIGSSSLLADLMFKVDESGPLEKLDGCQFPRFNYADENSQTKYNNPKYPPGKEYLRVWDILDCKIAKALGFGPEVSVPNLVLAIVGGFFTGGLGIIFFVATFVFAFFLLSMTIKALHVFIMSITSIIILLYVSPITITMAFFERTKNIFNGWLKQLLGFALQPMILFAYLGILVTLLDYVMLGSATYQPSTVEINGAQTVDTYGRVAPKIISCNGDADNDSLYCIFRIAQIKNFNGFEALGLGIPMLASMNSEKLSTIFKAAILMFIFSSFLDKITEIASKLVGGAELKPAWGSSAGEMMMKAYGVARAVQSRGVNAANKFLNPITGEGKLTKWGANKVSNLASKIADKGKSIAQINRKSGQSSTGNSSAQVGSDSTSLNVTAGKTTPTNSTSNSVKKPTGHDNTDSEA